MAERRDVTQQIAEDSQLPDTHAGQPFASQVIRQVEALLPPHIEASVETGCGKSTILLSILSDDHTVFCLDDRALGEASSVGYVESSQLTRRDRIRYVFGPTQLTLPAYREHRRYDVVLIDGPHGYPFPEIEYACLYPHLKPGGILILDDVNIPTIARLADFIHEDEMFDFVTLVDGTAVFRRTNAPTFDPLGDGWWAQRYNRRRVAPIRDIYLDDGVPVDAFSSIRIDERIHAGAARGVIAAIGCDASGAFEPAPHSQALSDAGIRGDEATSTQWARLLSDPTAQVGLGDLTGSVLATILVATDVPVTQIDRFFRYRMVQLLEGTADRDVALVVALRPGESAAPPGGFATRAAGSWPFRTTWFVCTDAESAARYSDQLGIPVHAVSRGRLAELIRHILSGLPPAVPAHEATPTADQRISVQIQPNWGRCGSSTAFENELGALIDRGDFVAHVFVPDAGENLDDAELNNRFERSRRETSVHVGAHVACTVGRQPDALHHGAKVTSLGQEFMAEVLDRQQYRPRDWLVGKLLERAAAAIVNHVVNLPLAITLSPAARILLDMHDCFSRNSLLRSRIGSTSRAFASRAELRQMFESESSLWRLPDACTAVNRKELGQLRRWNPVASIVLPKPYVPRITLPRQEDCLFHALLVADQHPFNIKALAWFLDEVWLPHPQLRGLRLAVAGRAANFVDTARYEPHDVTFVGFVDDLEALRGQTLMSIAPDLEGTGVAVKVLTALGAGHPLVATPMALRGYDPATPVGIPALSAPSGLADDIAELARSAEARRKRIEAGDALFANLMGSGFAGVLEGLPAPDPRAAAARTRQMHEALARMRQKYIRLRIAVELSRLSDGLEAVRRITAGS